MSNRTLRYALLSGLALVAASVAVHATDKPKPAPVAGAAPVKVAVKPPALDRKSVV